MRRFLAILLTLITILAIKEAFYIFTTTDAEIVKKQTQYSLVSLSIVLPLVLLTIWLWRGKKSKNHESIN